MDTGIKNILEDREHVVWQGVVNRKVMAVSAIIGILITLAIAYFFFSRETINYTSNGNPKQIAGSTIGIAILVIGLLSTIIGYVTSMVKEYAITKKRVIIKSGIIGTDFKSIYFDQIKNVIVDVGLIGKIFAVGTIKIDIGKTQTYSSGSRGVKSGSGIRIGGGNVRTRTVYDTFKHIEKPYEVYKYLQSSLSSRKESLYSGRADREFNPGAYSK